MKSRQELLSLLVERAFRYSPERPFRLASGVSSPYYIDCKQVTLVPRGMRLIGELFFEEISALAPGAVGGVVTGASPVTDAIVYTSELQNKPIRGFYVRKDPKKHGTERLVEGINENETAQVVIVDDVITSGGSILAGIEKLLAFDRHIEIQRIIVLVDRQEGGAELLRSKGFQFSAFFTKSELRDAYSERKTFEDPACRIDQHQVAL
ncbi:MAG: phosphoribosyltransferase family protein [Pseudomonadota bacterium]